MEQRPLRLGDTVDDYCPRERRVTNHVIVAIVGDAIKQTRCSTCDAEHVYKAAKEPRRRRKDGELFDDVLADVTAGQLVPPRTADPPGPASLERDVRGGSSSLKGPNGSNKPNGEDTGDTAEATGTDDAGGGEAEAQEPGDARPDDHWPAHRQLIRASLPRSESDPPPVRPIPEFTMHQRPFNRGGHARHGQGFSGNGNGNNFGNGFGGGHGRGQGGGQDRSGQGQPSGQFRRHRGGKHRRPR